MRSAIRAGLIVYFICVPSERALASQAPVRLSPESFRAEAHERESIEELGKSPRLADRETLEKVCERRAVVFRQFPPFAVPRDLSDELGACLEALERWKSSLATQLAAELEQRAWTVDELVWRARELSARMGNDELLERAVRDYFLDVRWRRVLAQFGTSWRDPRLLTLELPEPAIASSLSDPERLSNLVAFNLANIRGPASQRALYRWLRPALSRAETRGFAVRVLEKIPRGFAYDRGVDARLLELAGSSGSKGGTEEDGETIDERIRVLNGLGRREVGRSRQTLLDHLTHSVPSVQTAALHALAQMEISGERVVAALGTDDVPEEPFRSALIRVLVELGQHERAFSLVSDKNLVSASAVAAVLPAVDGNEELVMARDWLAGAVGRERFLILRLLAEKDHSAIVGAALSEDELVALYPYLARSKRLLLRELSMRVSREHRAKALALILDSRQPSDSEKRLFIERYPELWPKAVAVGGGTILSEIHRLVPDERAEYTWQQVVQRVALDADTIDFLASSPESVALSRLVERADIASLERVLRRPDRVLAMNHLIGLRAHAESARLNAIDAILISLGAPGSTTMVLDYRQREREIERILPGVLAAPLDPALIRNLLGTLIRSRPTSPDTRIALCRFQDRFPRRFVTWLNDAGGSGLRHAGETERVRQSLQMALALCAGEQALPLLVDLAVGGGERATRLAALASLAERDLGRHAERLHRLAGESDREIRFWTAAAVTNADEAWSSRLLVSSLDPDESPGAPRERRAMRGAFARMEASKRQEQLETMIEDGTANSLAVEMILDNLADSQSSSSKETLLQSAAWAILEPVVRAGNWYGILVASRLATPESVVAVCEQVSRILNEGDR